MVKMKMNIRMILNGEERWLRGMTRQHHQPICPHQNVVFCIDQCCSFPQLFGLGPVAAASPRVDEKSLSVFLESRRITTGSAISYASGSNVELGHRFVYRWLNTLAVLISLLEIF